LKLESAIVELLSSVVLLCLHLCFLLLDPNDTTDFGMVLADHLCLKIKRFRNIIL